MVQQTEQYKTLEDLFAVLSHASSEGFKNICAVSGATVPGEGAAETSRRLFLCRAPVREKEMRYCDMHCDALTATGAPQVTGARLAAGGCLLQCFAAFVQTGAEHPRPAAGR